MWTLGWIFLKKKGLFWFNGRIITKAQFDALLHETQAEINRRIKDGTTISCGDISGEVNIDVDEFIGDSEEDAELRDEGDTDEEDKTMRMVREESRTKFYIDEICRWEMFYGVGSSGTHHEDILPPPQSYSQPQPDQN